MGENFDLVERCFCFARDTRILVRLLPKTIANQSDAVQLVRSSGSVGANYIEANEALSKKDFVHRLRIARKEVKESIYWLRLIHLEASDHHSEEIREKLIKEATEIKLILSSIIHKQERDLK